MTLFEQHKADRRQRILEQARRLVARRGFDKLTMRDLAEASRVSVPTIYNLIGGKHQVVGQLLEQMMERIAARYAESLGDGFVDSVMRLNDAGLDELLETPAYTKELVHFFLASSEVGELRQGINERNVAMMAALIEQAKERGLVVAWVDAVTVATAMYAHYMAALIGWSKGDLESDELRNATRVGAALVLMGVALGHARDALEQLVRQTEPIRPRERERKGA